LLYIKLNYYNHIKLKLRQRGRRAHNKPNIIYVKAAVSGLPYGMS